MDQHITSRHNPRVKAAARLRNSRHRQRQGCFLIDGARETMHAIKAGLHIAEAYLCEELLHDPEAHQAAAALRAAAAATATVTADVFEKLSYGERSDGILAVVQTPHRSLEQLRLPADPLVAVIEGVEKPGNVGAILRSADGAGVDAVVVADPRTDLFNPNTIRASLGTVFRPNVCTATAAAALRWLQGLGLKAYAARPDAELLYTKVDYRSACAIVLGSEAEGLTDRWSVAPVQAIGLPMRGLADSLNVSAAAAVLFYEARRQRDGGG